VFWCFDDGDAGRSVFGEADFSAGPWRGADGLNAEAVCEDGVMADLVDAGGWELEPRGVAAVAIADVDEGAHFVHGHEVLDAVGEMLGE